MQAQETVDNQLLLKPDLLKNSSEPAQLPIDNEDTVFNPALISPADYQQASPDRPLAATQPSTPPAYGHTGGNSCIGLNQQKNILMAGC